LVFNVLLDTECFSGSIKRVIRLSFVYLKKFICHDRINFKDF
jgi:hypothetical protein